LLVNEHYLDETVLVLDASGHRLHPRFTYECLRVSLLYRIIPATINSDTYPSLTSLTIGPLRASSDILDKRFGLECIAARIEVLRVSISMRDGGKRLKARFWNSLTDRLLKPATNLRVLTLVSDRGASVTPIVKFDELSYPFLESLSLRHIQFREQGEENGVEGMIRRSRNTLRCIKLDRCSLHKVVDDDYEEEGLERFERRWTNVWESFSDELVNLRELVVRGMMSVSDRYQISEDGDIEAIEYETTEEDEERDAAALEALCQVVRSRSGGRAIVIEESAYKEMVFNRSDYIPLQA
jgi:hypothetical protein